jgi:hypothetical protein
MKSTIAFLGEELGYFFRTDTLLLGLKSTQNLLSAHAMNHKHERQCPQLSLPTGHPESHGGESCPWSLPVSEHGGPMLACALPGNVSVSCG